MTVTVRSHVAPDRAIIRRALISVADKAGLIPLAEALARHGVEIVSTGGTAGALAAAGVNVRDVAELTGFPEILDGRVKTLHPGVHGGLLAIRDEPEHAAALDRNGISPIDLLVVNLYPFEEVLRSGADDATQIENIDIGGPAMIRAAAKNHAYVAVITDPSDYDAVIEALDAGKGALPFELRRSLAAKAYARTAAYDAAIAGWFAERLGEGFPQRMLLSGRLSATMRYGENPHQAAAFYATGDQRPGAAGARIVQGKQLSFNNINDTDAAFELAAEFRPEEGAAIAIIKHANPCGVAVADRLVDAYEKALACDPVSAFGGIVAANCEIDADAARAITRIFTEVIIAPSVSEEAREIIAQKPNLRLLVTGNMPDPAARGLTFRSVAGGFLVQDRDRGQVEPEGLQIVTERAPGTQELADMLFAWRVAKHVKSNAIVYACNGATVGIGAGQMSRVDSARIAAWKAAEVAGSAGSGEPATVGAVVASDAFFPFADGLMAAVEAGATAVIQPGGSMRDAEVIAAADAHGIAMVFTGMRHFRH